MKSLFALLILLKLSTIIATLKVSPPKQDNILSHSETRDNGKNKELQPTVDIPLKIGEKNNLDNKVEKVENVIDQDKTNNIDPHVKSDQDDSNKSLDSKKNSNENIKNIVQDEPKTPKNVSWNNNVQQESGMLTKGMMLLLTISVFFMMFVAYKTYRRKSRYARIKKYGVRLSRGNVEMRPLPLDNEDEDETIFDLKNVPT